MERLVVLQPYSAMLFGLLFFTDSISTYTVLKVLVYLFVLVWMCTHLLFHLQFTVRQYAITGFVLVHFCSVFVPLASLSILHALMVKCLLTFLPAPPADHALAKIDIFVFFSTCNICFCFLSCLHNCFLVCNRCRG